MSDLQIIIPSWQNDAVIPDFHAFGKPGEDAPFAPSGNVSPEISWTGAPVGTKSFALLCHDPDVPSQPDDVNQADREVPADLPRVSFYHWVLVNIPMDVTTLKEGIGGSGISAGGKAVGQTAVGLTGRNDYTDWFAGDADMAGTYGGYDGPCPPWNDSLIHHYHFTIYALDIAELDLSGAFSGSDVLTAIEGHVLAQSTHVGTYAMNPRLRS